MLKLGRCRIHYTIKTILMKDSLSMTNTDGEKILQECQKSKDNKIFITHGTDTMTETANILGQVITNKTVVLTGAIVPYAFGSSDGLFNLESSLAFLQSLSPGVYISMNGKFFHWDNAKKNKEIGLFKELY
jgi:L-asparaginase